MVVSVSNRWGSRTVYSNSSATRPGCVDTTRTGTVMATMAQSSLLLRLGRLGLGSARSTTPLVSSRATVRGGAARAATAPLLAMDLGSTGFPVRIYQTLLRPWCPALPVDGWAGPRTAAACRTFQRAVGSAATGDMRRAADWDALLRDARVGLGDEGAGVRAAQTSLHVEVDGRFGPRTQDATLRYQRMANTTGHRMPMDGRYGLLTWAFTLRAY